MTKTLVGTFEVKETIASDVLTIEDISLMEKEEQLKKELKSIQDILKPKFEATVKYMGEGTHIVGNRALKLSIARGVSTSWKSMAEFLDPSGKLIEKGMKDPFISIETVTYKAKLV